MDCAAESLEMVASTSGSGGSHGFVTAGDAIISRKIVSKPDAAIQVVELSLSSRATASLQTGVAQLGRIL